MKVFALSGSVSRPEYQNGRVCSIQGYVAAESIAHAFTIAEEGGWHVTMVQEREDNTFIDVDLATCEPGFL